MEDGEIFFLIQTQVRFISFNKLSDTIPLYDVFAQNEKMHLQFLGYQLKLEAGSRVFDVIVFLISVILLQRVTPTGALFVSSRCFKNIKS